MLKFFELPYSKDAFANYISSETLDFHYEKHHRTYFDNLLKLISGTDLENEDLLSIIKKSFDQDNLKLVFNNASQVFNHDFYWKSLSPQKIEPSDFLKEKINERFSSWEKFIEEFKRVALAKFGSGWVWLVLDENFKIKIKASSNAHNPISENQIPLICIDVWEHAYYIDYRNRRGEYLDVLLNNLMNWNFLEDNLKRVIS